MSCLFFFTGIERFLDSRFKTSSNLLGHCKNQPKNKCEICLREFCTVMELNAHKQLGECEASAALFSQNNSEVYFDVNSIEVELNEVPGRFTPNTLNDMEKGNVVGGIGHKCHVCGKCFRKRWNFNQHMRSHSDERPFECSLCHRK